MLEIHSINGHNCPVIVCDMCGERLNNAAKAAVVFQNFQPEGAKIRMLHVHKGNIDGHTCHQEAEALLSAGGKNMVGWEEMKTFLSDLVDNAGFPPHDIEAHVSRRVR